MCGAALAARGDLAAARDQLRRAKILYANCGARRLPADVLAEQRGLASRGSRNRRDDTTPSTALTEREREIARMVALGTTNREIAGKLARSRRTVKTRVSRIFVKLGLPNRAALAYTWHENDEPGQVHPR